MNRKIASIVLGGLIGGAFDIAYAIIFSNLRSGVAPSRILQSVASGLLGSDAYTGGSRERFRRLLTEQVRVSDLVAGSP